MEMLTKRMLDGDLLEGGGTLTLPRLNIQQLQPGAQGFCLHEAFAGILPVAVHPLGS